ncbi:MAG: hypothetical protein ACOX4Z_00935 [Desulfobulbus sp.]|jgi:hypothetical protein|nr:hypothetical protein [Desulfobulbaceae bacterium]
MMQVVAGLGMQVMLLSACQGKQPQPDMDLCTEAGKGAFFKVLPVSACVLADFLQQSMYFCCFLGRFHHFL